MAMSLGLMRLAFGLGLILAALTASSLVAWRFGFDPALGTPLAWHLYSPLAVLAWARSWGLDQAYRPQFLSALTLPLLPMMLPFAVLWLRELYGPMRTPERDADEGLGRPADLRQQEGQHPPSRTSPRRPFPPASPGLPRQCPLEEVEPILAPE
jgi:hypothetical protein